MFSTRDGKEEKDSIQTGDTGLRGSWMFGQKGRRQIGSHQQLPAGPIQIAKLRGGGWGTKSRERGKIIGPFGLLLFADQMT